MFITCYLEQADPFVSSSLRDMSCWTILRRLVNRNNGLQIQPQTANPNRENISHKVLQGVHFKTRIVQNIKFIMLPLLFTELPSRTQRSLLRCERKRVLGTGCKNHQFSVNVRAERPWVEGLHPLAGCWMWTLLN